MRNQGGDLLTIQFTPFSQSLLKHRGIKATQTRVRRQHETKDGSPPRKIEFGVQLVVINVTATKIACQRLQPQLSQFFQDRDATRQFIAALRISAQTFTKLGQINDWHHFQIAMSGNEHRVQVRKIFGNLVSESSGLSQVRWQLRPAVAIAVLTPHIAALLNGQQRTMQVLNMASWTQHVLRLLDQADSL